MTYHHGDMQIDMDEFASFVRLILDNLGDIHSDYAAQESKSAPDFQAKKESIKKQLSGADDGKSSERGLLMQREKWFLIGSID